MRKSTARFTADPTQTTSADDRLVRVYVWDRVVRACHWLGVLAIVVLSVTGLSIGHPYVAVPGEAGQSFVMGTFRAVHYGAAIVFSVLGLVRVYWAFFGTPPARWHSFLPVTPEQVEETKKTFRFYMLLENNYPPVLSHNPLAGMAYLVLFAMFAIMILTGLGIYAASADVGSVFGVFAFIHGWVGLQTLRWVHHAVMWLILCFAVVHIYSSILSSHVEKNGMLESIFTGFKWAHPDKVEG